MNDLDQRFGETHRKLTALLTTHPDVAEWFILWLKGLDADYADGRPSNRTFSLVAETILARPTDYFSAALARLAGGLDITQFTTQEYHSGKWLAYFRLTASAKTCHSGEQPTLREALIALWLALLELAVEPCEHCAAGKVQDVFTKREVDCKFCNGSGRKYPGMLLALTGAEGDALAGGNR